MSLITVTKSDTLPITLADVKSHLLVEHDLDDDLITSYIWTAISYAEDYTGRDFTATTYDWVLSCWHEKFELPRVPVTAITSLKYYDSDNSQQTWSSSNYYTIIPTNMPAILVPDANITKPSLKARPDAITIRFSAGYTALPWQVDAAIKLIVGHLYENRQAEITGTITTELKLGVDRLLSQHRSVWGC
ncbi:head-tail connector protein [Bremerella sp. P1]|uniref:head-tail connector protein n=1 Tax=Bremerella sp. P1 TaxID=3026424 RepID=UPI0023689030|nr:head-tail connector protein [Bremerella sp. P1]WDI41829.1 head-tail connector protein [Bremerella sp. P1]